MKQGLGISYINLRNRKAYYALLNKRIRSEMSLDGAFPLREIVLAEPFGPVSEDEYHEACKRINAHSLAEFNHLAKTDTQKDLSKAKSLLENACAADEELAYFAELFPWTAEELYEDFYGETPEEAEDGRAALASWFIELGDREAFLKKKHEIDSWVAAQQKIGSAAKSDDR